MRYTITGSGSDGSERTVVLDADDEIEALTLAGEQGIVRSTAVRVRKSFTVTQAGAGEDYFVFGAAVWEPPDPADELALENLLRGEAPAESDFPGVVVARRYELSFGRGVEADEIGEMPPGWGQEIELSYWQGKGPYVHGRDCVAACRLARDRLEVDLSQTLVEGIAIEGFDVSLNLDDAAYVEFRDGLRWIFQHRSGVLTIHECGN